MALVMKANIIRGLNKVKEGFGGRMVVSIKETLLIIKLKVMGCIVGMITDSILVIGSRIRCMVKESIRMCSLGLMVGSMKEIMLMAVKKAMEYFGGLMEGSMMVNG